MKRYISSGIGMLRLVAFLEGISLLVLIFIAMPFKYFMNEPALVKWVGQIHGILFLVFIAATYQVSRLLKWKTFQKTWMVYLSSIIPFGTFYIDHKILKPVHNQLENKSNQ